MASNSSSNEQNQTSACSVDYTTAEKTAIMWAVSIGTIIGTFPLNYFYTKYGARWPFFIAGVMSSVSTALIPKAAMFDLRVLLLLRFIQGVSYSANFGAIGVLCVRWAPLSETSIFISTLTSFTPFSATATNFISGWLCNTRFGWPSAFYFHALFGALMFLFWALYYRDDPQFYPIISEKELHRIQEGKTLAHIQRDSFVPYKELLKNKVVLIVWFNAFVSLVTLTLLITYAPLYFHEVLGFSILETGTLASISSAIHLPIKIAGGVVSDRLTIISERGRMWLFNTISVGMTGVFCTLIGIFPNDWGKTGVVLFTLATTFIGLNTGGYYKCGTLCARQYAHVVLTVIQFMKCVGLFVAPGVHGIFVQDESRYDQWRYVFWVHGILLIIANFIFLPIATDKPASFTNITRLTKNYGSLSESNKSNRKIEEAITH
ncbi:hypothetical protein RB195_016835 [Necator americanus]